jgi:hypothetical protein
MQCQQTSHIAAGMDSTMMECILKLWAKMAIPFLEELTVNKFLRKKQTKKKKTNNTGSLQIMYFYRGGSNFINRTFFFSA